MRCTRLTTLLVAALSLRIGPTICGARLTPSAAIDSQPRPTSVAHGYLTLAPATAFLSEFLQVDEPVLRVGYGVEKVRFPPLCPSVVVARQWPAHLGRAERRSSPQQFRARLRNRLRRCTSKCG